MPPVDQPPSPAALDGPLPERSDNFVNRLVDRVDALHRRIPPVAFLVAVFKKFGDDRSGRHSAVIAYYGFFALFPLLLVLVTVLGFLLEDNPGLQEDIVDSAVSQFPVIGDQVADNVGSLRGSGFALAFGLVAALWAGLGATLAAQDALNAIFGVPVLDRPNFWLRRLRGLGTLGVLGAVVLAGTAVGSSSRWVAVGGTAGWVGFVAVTLVVNSVSVYVLTHLLCRADLGWREALPGAVFGGAGWLLLQLFGSLYVERVVRGASQTYGLFAVVIGLLSWIYLQARIFLLGAEVSTVVRDRLWPRALVRERPTIADLHVAELIATREERLRDTERRYVALQRRRRRAQVADDDGG